MIILTLLIHQLLKLIIEYVANANHASKHMSFYRNFRGKKLIFTKIKFCSDREISHFLVKMFSKLFAKIVTLLLEKGYKGNKQTKIMKLKEEKFINIFIVISLSQ